jgi:ferric-dicitrate binding protein FerR (iron transport regulator)
VAESQEKRFKNDVAPGTNHAILTLADGSQVILDSAHSGALATEGAVKVQKTADGQIVYQSTAPVTEVKYNTITVPKGSQVVNLTLADGSKVWLDAASTITYPTAFTGKERRVEINGQAYFEVAKTSSNSSGGGKKIPFIVEMNGASVEVLGTHFNVNAYEDEKAIKVTLLEGSVRVALRPDSYRDQGDKALRVPQGDKGAVVIKPGEQAVLRPDRYRDQGDRQIKVVDNVDLSGVMAWKEGMFKFQGTTIEPIMKQLTRWYDVEVVYENKPTDIFVTTIPRDVSVSQVLKILETTGRVHFRIEGKKVVVMR